MSEISVSLWHPFTARSIGWDDEDVLPILHSRPHVSALLGLRRDLNARVRVEYLTDRRRPRAITRDGLRFVFWPRTRWIRRRSDQFRNEWSLLGVARAFVRPADVTVINTSGHGGGLTRALGRVLRVRKRPYIAMIGGLNATLQGPQFDYFKRAAAVVVHNHHLERSLIDAGIDKQRVSVLRLGVDTDLFRPAPSSSAPTGVVLFVGRVLEHKGVHLLVQAMASLIAAHPDAQLHIVGPEPDVDYSGALRRQIAEGGLDHCVRFVGVVPHAELPRWYQAASVFVLPTATEGFGMVLVESLACGTPVVALGGGGPDGIVDSGQTGLLVEPHELTSALATLLADEAMRRRMAACARADALERFSLAVSDEQMKQLVVAALQTSAA